MVTNALEKIVSKFRQSIGRIYIHSLLYLAEAVHDVASPSCGFIFMLNLFLLHLKFTD
jgi:hypothetical protein